MHSEFHLTESYCSFRMDKCFSCLQLIFLFIITGKLLTFSVCLFRSLIFSTHLGITWPNGIIWLTLVTIVKRRINQYLLWNQIMIVPALNIPDSFQVCNLLNSNCMCVFQPDREQQAIIHHLTSNLNLFLSLKVKRFRRFNINRKSVGSPCSKPPPYAFWGTCTFGEMRVHAQKLLWKKECSHWW